MVTKRLSAERASIEWLVLTGKHRNKRTIRTETRCGCGDGKDLSLRDRNLLHLGGQFYLQTECDSNVRGPRRVDSPNVDVGSVEHAVEQRTHERLASSATFSPLHKELLKRPNKRLCG